MMNLKCPNKTLLIVTILLLISSHLFSGDVASYVNLGFSTDSQYFMFGQYGVLQDSSYPFAETYIVDLSENEFVPNGESQAVPELPVDLGQDGSGSLYNLLHEVHDQVLDFGIDHSRQGRLVYLFVNGSEPKSEIDFRDFNTGNRFQIELVQQSRKNSEEFDEAAFHIQLTVTTKNGDVRAFTIGIPGYYRKEISYYRIKQVVLSPDEKSMVFVVEKIGEHDDGLNIRYMVETVTVF